MKKIVMVIIGLMLFSGCGKKFSRKHLNLDKRIKQESRGTSDLERYIDEEYGVVCYTVRNARGISCLRK
jgi:hypothetical protein